MENLFSNYQAQAYDHVFSASGHIFMCFSISKSETFEYKFAFSGLRSNEEVIDHFHPIERESWRQTETSLFDEERCCNLEFHHGKVLPQTGSRPARER